MNTCNSTVLDLAAFYGDDSRPAGSERSRWLWMASALVILAAGIGAASLARGFQDARTKADAVVRLPMSKLGSVETLTVDDKAQILMRGLEAARRNLAIPLLAQPLDKVEAFAFPSMHGNAFPTALKCLTQAIYYEAAVEPIEGRRAVAQVVLNRMRHPAYPKSVCGVVYEGSYRRTGCQFSFTCDGSLLRAPAALRWREAEMVARDSLAGHVEANVGTATHYHADYVLPKWAFELGKIAQIGRHIFYRFNGNWGRSRAFTGRYLGFEQIPALDMLALRDRAAADGMLAESEIFSTGLTVPPHVTDRHAAADVGGRLDTTKPWRLTIPDPVEANTRYRQALEVTDGLHAREPKLAMETQATEALQ
jgi:hypothetical protein